MRINIQLVATFFLLLAFSPTHSLAQKITPKTIEKRRADWPIDVALKSGDRIDLKQRKYLDKVVRLDGFVKSTIGKRGYLMTLDNSKNSAAILVINATRMLLPLSTGEHGGFIGRVQLLNSTDLERQFGFTLDANAFKSYQGKPVIIARTISDF
jgi:hypothetical protein